VTGPNQFQFRRLFDAETLHAEAYEKVARQLLQARNLAQTVLVLANCTASLVWFEKRGSGFQRPGFSASLRILEHIQAVGYLSKFL
jgi:hypothetical protein